MDILMGRYVLMFFSYFGGNAAAPQKFVRR
jgi:hypothetical protein